MKSNVEKAVAIIATLSLMLGLSLGQIHQQQQEIRQLKAAHHVNENEHIRIMINNDRLIELSTFETLERVHHKLREKEEKLRHFRCRIGQRVE